MREAERQADVAAGHLRDHAGVEAVAIAVGVGEVLHDQQRVDEHADDDRRHADEDVGRESHNAGKLGTRAELGEEHARQHAQRHAD